MLKTKMTHEEKRSILKWIGLLLIVHFIGFLIYAILIDKIIKDLILDEMLSTAKNFMLCVSIAFQFLFCIYYSFRRSQYVDYKMNLKSAMKEKDFSVNRYFLSAYGKENKRRIIIFAVFQIPFAVFYAIFGYSFLYLTRFEMFYALESGLYAKIGMWPVAFILNILLFSLLFLGFQYLFLYIKSLDIKKNAPTGFYDN